MKASIESKKQCINQRRIACCGAKSRLDTRDVALASGPRLLLRRRSLAAVLHAAGPSAEPSQVIPAAADIHLVYRQKPSNDATRLHAVGSPRFHAAHPIFSSPRPSPPLLPHPHSARAHVANCAATICDYPIRNPTHESDEPYHNIHPPSHPPTASPAALP